MKIAELINYMENRKEPKGEYSIENAKNLLKQLDSPQNKINVIHVTGTNGKGSVCSYITNSLIDANIKVGTFISPYIEDINESIKINGLKISDEEFVNIGTKVKTAVKLTDEKGYYPTYFDILSSIAYEYFYEKNVDIAVIEVGMGGRMDSTNTIKSPLLSIICSISLDHTNFLGNTISKIAYEKAGIIKENSPVFCYDIHNDAKKVIEDECKLKNTISSYIDKNKLKIKKIYEGGSEFIYKEIEYKISLSGEHQIYNAMLAIDALNFLKEKYIIKNENIKNGLLKAKNIARVETIKTNPHIILDGSHNLEGIIALKNYIKNLNYKNLILGFSVLGDKEYVNIINELFPLADKIIVTEIQNERKLPIEDLEKLSLKYHKEVYAIKDSKEAFEKSTQLTKEDDLLIWCGSLYLMKIIRPCAINM